MIVVGVKLSKDGKTAKRTGLPKAAKKALGIKVEKLTPKQALFAKEYLVDLNATQAAIRAGYSKKTAQEIGAQNLSKLMIADEIQRLMNIRSEKVEITAEMVLNRWWEIANADPRDLVEFRRDCCEHCYGINHNFQWKTEEEYIAAYERAIAWNEINQDDPIDVPDNSGGYGYNPTKPAVDECPKCFGKGYARSYAKDTRKISRGAAILYAGVKETKEGLEIKMQDQGKALENVARHLGMFTEKIDLTVNEDTANKILTARNRAKQTT